MLFKLQVAKGLTLAEAREQPPPTKNSPILAGQAAHLASTLILVIAELLSEGRFACAGIGSGKFTGG